MKKPFAGLITVIRQFAREHVAASHETVSSWGAAENWGHPIHSSQATLDFAIPSSTGRSLWNRTRYETNFGGWKWVFIEKGIFCVGVSRSVCGIAKIGHISCPSRCLIIA